MVRSPPAARAPGPSKNGIGSLADQSLPYTSGGGVVSTVRCRLSLPCVSALAALGFVAVVALAVALALVAVVVVSAVAALVAVEVRLLAPVRGCGVVPEAVAVVVRVAALASARGPVAVAVPVVSAVV
jgi:hypothetical protein